MGGTGVKHVADGDEDEVAALTPNPVSTKGWTQKRWALHYREHVKALQARIVELQTEAGIRTEVERLEQAPLFSRIDLRPFNPKAHEAERDRAREDYLYGLRRLYFSVEDEALRKRLIRLDRAKDVAVMHFHEAENRDEHHAFETLAARPSHWVTTATIEVLVATLLGALIGHAAHDAGATSVLVNSAAGQVGAIAGAAVGLVWAIRLRDLAEHARKKEITNAAALLAEYDRTYQSILDEAETFTGWEEYSGKLSE
jgi:hypothetical protein